MLLLCVVFLYARDITYANSNIDDLVLDLEEDCGAVPYKKDYDTMLKNSQVLTDTLNSIEPGSTLLISNKTFHLLGGVYASNINNVVIQLDGTLSFDNDRDNWPVDENGHVLESIYLTNISNFVLTSSGAGTLDGNGQPWWGAVDFLRYQENRPRLFHVKTSRNVMIENILFKDSAFWTCYMEDSDGLEISHSQVSARWTRQDNHTLIDLQAFNTDGFDVTGKNVYIHDCDIWCQDDCISVKDGSEDMLFERITCSGLGLVIGSIGDSVVNNITFRDSYMPYPVKGIYMKTRWRDSAPTGSASISNVLYENITMDSPEQYGIWIGPAQQTGQPCSLAWTLVPRAECLMSGFQTWTNITLRNIIINNPKNSPGVLMGNISNPIHNLTFDGVVVNNPGQDPWGDKYYYCEDVEGVAKGGTSPIPPCFAVEQ